MKCLQRLERAENGRRVWRAGRGQENQAVGGSEGPPKAWGCESGPGFGDRVTFSCRDGGDCGVD